MKIPKRIEPLLAGLFASIIIGILSFLSFETSTGFWLMFSFGSSTLIVLVFHDSEFAQPANVFFGHLLAIVIGILFNEFLGISYLTLGLSVGTTVTLMMYFKINHYPNLQITTYYLQIWSKFINQGAFNTEVMPI